MGLRHRRHLDYGRYRHRYASPVLVVVLGVVVVEVEVVIV